MDKNIGGLVIIGLLLWLLTRQQLQQVSNEETWEWKDRRGNPHLLTIHREVKAQ